MQTRHALRTKRHTALRHKVVGTALRPRVSVYRGLKHLYVQLIDDAAGKTLVGLSDKKLVQKATGMERATAVATELAAQCKTKKITSVVFDRGGFRYHGQIKQIADTLREAGVTV